MASIRYREVFAARVRCRTAAQQQIRRSQAHRDLRRGLSEHTVVSVPIRVNFRHKPHKVLF